LLVYNPESGKTKPQIREESLSDIAKNYGYQLFFKKTRQLGDASSFITKLSGYDIVIAVGGDGTLHEVVEGNFKREKPITIGHLPQGTVNDVGKMYGFTKNIYTDLSMLLSGKIKNIDTGLINNKPFVYVACFGNLVSVSFDTPRELKEKYGKIGYFLYGLKKINRKVKMYKIKYTVDEQTYEDEFSFIFISNTDRIGGFSGIYSDVKLDDKKFEVALCKAKNFKECMSVMRDLVVNDASKTKNMIYFKTDNLKIEFLENPHESWCLDGEEYKCRDKMNFEFTNSQKSQMLVPCQNIEKLFIKRRGK